MVHGLDVFLAGPREFTVWPPKAGREPGGTQIYSRVLGPPAGFISRTVPAIEEGSLWDSRRVLLPVVSSVRKVQELLAHRVAALC